MWATTYSTLIEKYESKVTDDGAYSLSNITALDIGILDDTIYLLCKIVLTFQSEGQEPIQIQFLKLYEVNIMQK